MNDRRKFLKTMGVGVAATAALPALAVTGHSADKENLCAERCKFEGAVEDLEHGGIVGLVKVGNFYHSFSASFSPDMTPEMLQRNMVSMGKTLGHMLKTGFGRYYGESHESNA